MKQLKAPGIWTQVPLSCGARTASTARISGIILLTGLFPTVLFFGCPSISASGISASLDRKTEEHRVATTIPGINPEGFIFLGNKG
ncbi:hypothetical protein TNCT_129391 [Trichonephila clavata]|uniref:Uncharacterized protein n=1 Tax=Trichonephila clavata TaxID=2740835 RepID=A0A8X6HF97_TRICU|nr:hypothetical protein TNCT_129391 [Trichonephila clavata]